MEVENYLKQEIKEYILNNLPQKLSGEAQNVFDADNNISLFENTSYELQKNINVLLHRFLDDNFFDNESETLKKILESNPYFIQDDLITKGYKNIRKLSGNAFYAVLNFLEKTEEKFHQYSELFFGSKDYTFKDFAEKIMPIDKTFRINVENIEDALLLKKIIKEKYKNVDFFHRDGEYCFTVWDKTTRKDIQKYVKESFEYLQKTLNRDIHQNKGIQC